MLVLRLEKKVRMILLRPSLQPSLRIIASALIEVSYRCGTSGPPQYFSFLEQHDECYWASVRPTKEAVSIIGYISASKDLIALE